MGSDTSPQEQAEQTTEEVVWDPGARLQMEAFAERVLDLTGCVMEHQFPEWSARLKAIRDAGNGTEDITAVPPPPTSAKVMGKYRALLGQMFDLELGVKQLRRAYRLMATRLPPQVLQALKMTAGEWWWYHESTWLVMLSAVADRAEALVTKAFRQLGGGVDLQKQKDTKKQLLAVTGDLKKRAKEHRNAVAHGVHAGDVGPVMDIAKAGLWEHHSVLRLWVPPLRTLTTFGDTATVNPWIRHRLEITLSWIQEIDTVIAQLDAAIDWEYLKRRVGQ